VLIFHDKMIIASYVLINCKWAS